MPFSLRFFLQLVDVRLFLVSIIGIGTLSVLLGEVASILLLFLFLILSLSLLTNLTNSIDVLNSLSPSLSKYFQRLFSIASIILFVSAFFTLGIALLSGFEWRDFSFGGVVDTLVGYFWIFTLMLFLFVFDRGAIQIGTRKSLRSMTEILMIFGWPFGLIIVSFAFLLSPLLAFVLASTFMWIMGWHQKNMFFKRLSLKIQKKSLVFGIGVYLSIGILGATLSIAFGQGSLYYNHPIGAKLYHRWFHTEENLSAKGIKDARDLARWIARKFPNGEPQLEGFTIEEIQDGFRKIEELCEPGYPVGFIGYICRGKSISRPVSSLRISMDSRDKRFKGLLDSAGDIARILAYLEISGLSEVGLNQTFKDFATQIENDNNRVVRGFVSKISMLDLRKPMESATRTDKELLILFYPSKE